MTRPATATVRDQAGNSQDELPTALLPNPATEANRLWRLRFQILTSTMAQALRQARLRIAIVALLTAIFWLGMLWLFYESFTFLQKTIVHAPLRMQAVHAVYNVFYLSLFIMLAFSAAVVGYGVLFRGQETKLLLALPISAGRLVSYKFQEVLGICCWGFVLLGLPMLLSYGTVVGAPWYYYACLPLFIVSFAIIAAGIGFIICLAVVYLFPRFRIIVLAIIGLPAVALAAWVVWSLTGMAYQDLVTPEWFQETLARLRFSEQKLLPSWWLSSGLLEAAHPAQAASGQVAWRETLGFLCLLTTSALVVQMCVGTLGGKLFPPALSQLASVRGVRFLGFSGRFQFLVSLFTWPLPRIPRLLVRKDIIVFFRDPVQWSQFLILVGLLFLYVVFVRRFQYDESLVQWMTIIGFLNLGVVGLVLATFTTRFVFPTLSLEGRRMWILGTLPVRRETIVLSKFAFACSTCLLPCLVLVLLGDVVLKILKQTPSLVLVHLVVCAALCIGLCAISVGLGAHLTNLREESPSKVAAGIGGTLALVFSVFYVVVSVAATAIPSYFWVQRQRSMTTLAGPSVLHEVGIQLGQWNWVIGSVVAVMMLSAFVSAVSLWIGARSFRRLEF